MDFLRNLSRVRYKIPIIQDQLMSVNQEKNITVNGAHPLDVVFSYSHFFSPKENFTVLLSPSGISLRVCAGS